VVFRFYSLDMDDASYTVSETYALEDAEYLCSGPLADEEETDE